MKQLRRFAAATLALGVAVACTGTSEVADPTTSAASASSNPPLSASPSPSAEPTPEPIPARTPRGIAAITETGDVVLLDLDTGTARTIASFPPVRPGDPGFIVASFLTDIAVLPDGRILLSTCCEPAAGYIRVLNDRGKEVRKRRPLQADDPEVDLPEHGSRWPR